MSQLSINAEERMPFLNLLFWAFFASYVMHILDETLLNGGFVQWIAENFWPQYRVRMFFWFNAGAVIAIVISNVLFDSFGGHWVILPIIWLTGFVTHAITFHLYWTIRRDTYSPGLLTRGRPFCFRGSPSTAVSRTIDRPGGCVDAVRIVSDRDRSAKANAPDSGR
jgi:hypothetical protein